MGYHAEKVETQYRHDTAEILSKIPVMFLPVESEPSGAFGSVARALHTAKVTCGCLVLGVDVIVTQYAMTKFLTSIRSKARTTFMVSPMLAVAPTHGHIRLNDKGEILEYRKSSLCARQTSQDGRYCDVGIRYFSADFVGECRLLSLAGPSDFDDIVPSMVDKGRVFESHIFNERWLHFGNSRDFLQKPL